jgi:vancomycin resistance protein YoaR
MKELEDLEKQFILNEDMEDEDIKDLISRILKFCKIDNKGFVVIQKSSLIMPQKIMLVLSARYLANKLQQKLGRENINIYEVVTAHELSSMLKEKDTVIIARLKDLKDAKKVISSERGVYKIAPYAIKDFLTDLEGGKNE